MSSSNKPMISHEDYGPKAEQYKKSRIPIGADKIQQFFLDDQASAGGEAARQLVIDAGCGTGNYVCALLSKMPNIQLYGVDASDAMMGEAKKQVEGLPEAAKTNCADLRVGNLSNPDVFAHVPRKADCILNTMVMHHFGSHAACETVLKNFYDGLNPNGGKLAINYCPPENQEKGIWWSLLLPKAMAEFRRRAPSVQEMEAMLTKIGFVDIRFEPLLGDNMFDADKYCDAAGFLAPGDGNTADKHNGFGAAPMFAKMDSTFAMSDAAEVQAAKESVKKMLDEGTWDAWFAETERVRKQLGQSVNVYATKRSGGSRKSHEDYSPKAAEYKVSRVPIGADKIQQFFLADKANPTVIDAGCGTGNYVCQLLSNMPNAAVYGVDASHAMIQQATKAVESLPENAKKNCASLQVGNLADPKVFSHVKNAEGEGKADCILNCQVMHHFGSHADCETVLKNFYDGLHPNGGKLAINYCPPENQERGIWWSLLLPKAMAEFRRRAPSVQEMEAMLKKIGFAEVRFEPLGDENLYVEDKYGDAAGFLAEGDGAVADKHNGFGAAPMFAKMDSTFAMSDAAEVQAAKDTVKKMLDEKTWDAWFAEQEGIRKKLGQTVNVYATRK